MDAGRLLAQADAPDRRCSPGRTTRGAALSDVRALVAAGAARIGGSEARGEAELLLAHALERTRAWLFAWPEHVPTDVQRERFERLVEARAGGMPVAYLLGRRAFWSLDLAVTPAVLIPRPETELLVELALERVPEKVACGIADLGTGSGALALALAHERPLARVRATDLSTHALDVARSNARRLGLANIEFAHGDWCDALGDARFDLIVSNPPYIAADDPHLSRGDPRHEPTSALASGADGLDAIRTIVATAPSHLLPGGWLLIEHGWEQATQVRDLLERRGLSSVRSARDIAGHERVSFARL